MLNERYVYVQLQNSTAALPPQLWQLSSCRRTAVCDFLTRRFAAVVAAAGALPNPVMLCMLE